MIVDEDEYLSHYGILRRSGRYPWGSSNNVVTRSEGFLDTVRALKDEGLKDVEIARGLGMSTTDLRANKSIANNQIKQSEISMAQRLKDKGMSNVAIAERMFGNPKKESSVRALLADGAQEKADILITITNMLKDRVDEKKYVDVGVGVENHIGISNNRLKIALAMIRQMGYEVHTVKVQQLGTRHETDFKILAPPGTTQREVWLNRDKIQQIMGTWSEDGGRTLLGIKPPLSIDSSRVAINYKEDGGGKLDGVIFVRPGVEDVSLGESRYAQVRILVDDGHYLKGMAMYSNDLPDGVDLLFNTNKSNTGDDLDAMKPVTGDADNPFGASIRRQLIEKDVEGNERVTSAMNMIGLMRSIL